MDNRLKVHAYCYFRKLYLMFTVPKSGTKSRNKSDASLLIILFKKFAS